MPAKAIVRNPTKSLRNVEAGRFLPRRVIGIAPATCAIVIARIMPAPPLASPTKLRARSEKATGPAACGTDKVADEANQRMSGQRPDGLLAGLSGL
ncbi:hypothetical protein GCM10010836_01940 [Aminobacter aminovorans]